MCSRILSPDVGLIARVPVLPFNSTYKRIVKEVRFDSGIERNVSPQRTLFADIRSHVRPPKVLPPLSILDVAIGQEERKRVIGD